MSCKHFQITKHTVYRTRNSQSSVTWQVLRVVGCQGSVEMNSPPGRQVSVSRLPSSGTWQVPDTWPYLFRGQWKMNPERWTWFREDGAWTFLFRGQRKMNHERWTWFREDGAWTFLFRGQRKMNHEHWTWFREDGLSTFLFRGRWKMSA